MAEFKGENLIFEHASYLNDFDDGYDPNEDPDFESPEGLDDSEYDTEDEIEEESKLDHDEFDDTRVCFRGEQRGTSLGPCDHICCKVWHLEPIHSSKPDSYCPMIRHPYVTMVRHMTECTDKECKNPNATGILVKARILARASKIFNSRTAARLKSKAKAFRTTV